ncbi:MAG: HAD-IA family hydrolase [Desulfobacterales bacterium]|nr:HAD-IA family hydrolase [Desulfobacterales bacterium]
MNSKKIDNNSAHSLAYIEKFKKIFIDLKDWYSQNPIDKFIESLSSLSTRSELENFLSQNAPWINSFKEAFLPYPIILENIPKNLGVLVVGYDEGYCKKIEDSLNNASNKMWRIDKAKSLKDFKDKLNAYLKAEGLFSPIDVILLDIDITKEDILILKYIREEKKLSIPVIILTNHYGNPLEIIDCLENGANFYAAKTEIDNLPSYIVKVISSSLPRMDLRSESADFFDETDIFLLRHLCYANSDIRLDHIFTNKEDSKKIFNLSRWNVYKGSYHQELPIIVKIAPAESLKNEYINYQNFVERYVSYFGAKIERFLIYKERSIIAYTNVRMFKENLNNSAIHEVYDILNRYDSKEIPFFIETLKEVISSDIGAAWYRQAKLPFPSKNRFVDHYAYKMPDIIVLTMKKEDVIAKKIENEFDLFNIQPGQTIALTGEIYSNKKKMFLSCFGSQLKISLDGTFSSLKNGERITIEGEVLKNLASILKEEWTQVCKDYDTSPKQFASVTQMNPFDYIYKVLLNPLYGKISIIHGDFHMNNFLLDLKRKRGWLIDFGSTGIGHVCFDFVRLETDIRTRLLAGLFKNEKSKWFMNMLMFELSLPPFSFPMLIDDRNLYDKLCMIKEVIKTIRFMAHQYFNDADDWREYFQSLFCYALNTFKFKKERKQFYPCSRLFPMACAIVSQMYLTQSEKGFYSPIKLVIFDVWGTLLVGKGNLLIKYLQNTYPFIQLTQLNDLKTELLSKDLSVEECVKRIQDIIHFSKRENDSPCEFTRDTYHLLEEQITIQLRPGVKDIIEKLHRSGIQLGIISNDSAFGYKKLMKKLRSEGIWDIFAQKLFSFKEQILKPNPRLFQVMLDTIGVKPHESVMVGDNYSNDIIPAQKLGIHTFHIQEQGRINRIWDLLLQYNKMILESRIYQPINIIDADEVEFKFEFNETNQKQIVQIYHNFLSYLEGSEFHSCESTPTIKQQLDTYLDDDEFTFYKNKVILRIREAEGQIKVTLKTLSSANNLISADGLYLRVEEETTITEAQKLLLFSGQSIEIHPYQKVKDLFPNCGFLTPKLKVDNNRQVFYDENKRIKICLDTFNYVVNEKNYGPFYEIEIENKEAEIEELNKLGKYLKEKLKLVPSAKNKYERGVDKILKPISYDFAVISCSMDLI